ncbi:MAG TPA: hypothetical protein PKY71_05205 [Smithellaceae bacterium]|nr:hypothetical protein [Smithellaceae bacterium]HPL96925.1 hypothetical protein [Smithellaceae bacterium]HQF83771.1 hypothetical protein [Smithellaceae bacterium]HQG79888.1 hypothetical protein [Smithellaceae bacterium]
MKRVFFWAFFILLWMAGLPAGAAAAGEGLTLLVEGRAKIVKEDEALGRSQAIQDALENALIRAAERIVTDRKAPEKLNAVKAALAGKADRYIGNYRIVSEIRQEDFYQVEAQVLVLEKLLGEDLIQMGLLPQQRSGDVTAVYLSVDHVEKYSDFIGIRNFLQSMPRIVKSPYPCRLGWHQADFDLILLTEVKLFIAQIEQSGRYAVRELGDHQDGVRILLGIKQEGQGL